MAGMNKKRTLLLGIGLAIAAGAWVAAWYYKSVTLVVDGVRQPVAGFALRVGDALRLAGVALGPYDHLTPPQDAWLNEGDTLTLERAVPIAVWAEGRSRTMWSASRLPADWLEQAEVTLAPGDILLVNGLPVSADELQPLAAAHGLQVRRAQTVTLRLEGQDIPLTTTAATVGQALWEAGYTLFAADALRPPANTPLTAGLVISLEPSRLLTIQTRSGQVALRTAASTVGEALSQAGLSPQGLDYSSPPSDAPLPADGRIRLSRVTETLMIEQEYLPFETVWQGVSDLKLDERQQVHPGAPGIIARRVRVRYEDGVETSRRSEAEWQASAPQNEIMGYGTQVVQQTLDTPDGPITYYRSLSFWATSYSPADQGNDGTASGERLRKGIVAADLSYLPMGTQVYIPGYGFGVVGDTGRIIGRWIDLGYSDGDYVSWHQWVTVYFLWPPPAYIPPTIPPPERY